MVFSSVASVLSLVSTWDHIRMAFTVHILAILMLTSDGNSETSQKLPADSPSEPRQHDLYPLPAETQAFPSIGLCLWGLATVLRLSLFCAAPTEHQRLCAAGRTDIYSSHLWRLGSWLRHEHPSGASLVHYMWHKASEETTRASFQFPLLCSMQLFLL